LEEELYGKDADNENKTSAKPEEEKSMVHWRKNCMGEMLTMKVGLKQNPRKRGRSPWYTGGRTVWERC